MASVFLSYRQVNGRYPDHQQRVRELGKRLRTAGITVVLDQFAQEEEFNYGGPPNPNGWAGWSYEQVDMADKVVIIGSPEYYRSYEDKETPGDGIGCAIEARRIFQKLYQTKGHNERFRIAVLSDGDDTGIPDHIAGYHRFYPNRASAQFDELVQWLQSGAGTTVPSIVTNIPWPTSSVGYLPKLANREAEFDGFRAMLTSSSRKRALLLEAPGRRGKSTLLRECRRYVNEVLPAEACVTIDFNVNPSKDSALENLRIDLSRRLPKFALTGTTYDLRLDLRNLDSPTVLLFDSYEKASPEADEFVRSLLLADMEKLPALRIVLAGQKVPDHTNTLWADSVDFFSLEPISDPRKWEVVARRDYPHLEYHRIETITWAARGEPNAVCTLLQALETQFKNQP